MTKLLTVDDLAERWECTSMKGRGGVGMTTALMTVAEVARELRVSPATVYREIADGKLAIRQVRRKSFVHRADLDAYLKAARREVQPVDSTAPQQSRRRISLKATGLIGDDDFGYSG